MKRLGYNPTETPAAGFLPRKPVHAVCLLAFLCLALGAPISPASAQMVGDKIQLMSGIDGLDGPSDVAADVFGNVYVTSFNNDRIFKVDPTGAITEPVAAGVINNPTEIAATPDGNVYVLSGITIKRIAPGGAVSDFYSHPDMVHIVAGVNNIVWVGNKPGNTGIVALEPDGTPHMHAWDFGGVGKPSPRPTVDSVGDFYVTRRAFSSSSFRFVAGVGIQPTNLSWGSQAANPIEIAGSVAGPFQSQNGSEIHRGINTYIPPQYTGLNFHPIRADAAGHLFQSVGGGGGALAIVGVNHFPPGVTSTTNGGDGQFERPGETPTSVSIGPGAVYYVAFSDDTVWRVHYATVYDFGDAPESEALLVTKDGDGGARHEAFGPTLGPLRDGEIDAVQVGAFAHGDDGDASDDEDGIIAYVNPLGVGTDVDFSAIVGSTMQVGVLMEGADTAYLQVFFLDGAASTQLVTDEVLSPGENIITLSFPSAPATPPNAVLRFRLTDYPSTTTPVGVAGPATNGEVEDYLIAIEPLAAPEVNVRDGRLEVRVEGSDIVFYNADGTQLFRAPASGFSDLTITGTGDDDTVRMDWDVVAAIGGLDAVTFDGAGGDDTLVLEGSVLPDLLVYNHETASDGNIRDDLGNELIFTNLAPIIDHLIVTTRVFNFVGGTETIELSPDGDNFLGNGYSFIDSDVAEQVVFANPTERLIIDGETGEDTISIGELDTPLAGGFLDVIVTGFDAYDAFGAPLGVPTDDASPDVFTAAASPIYPISIAGGDPPAATCPGDALLFDLSNGAVVDTITKDAMGDGTVTFLPPFLPITFTSIESVGDADIQVTLNRPTLFATEDLSVAAGNALVVTVTNNGPYQADCITLTIDPALSTFLHLPSGTPSVGTFLDPTWDIASLAAGESATLTIEGFLIPDAPADITFTASALQDVSLDNNTASVELSMGFLMPPKTQINAALHYDKTVTGGLTYQALVVGLFQGAPGIDGAVWCKIPDAVGGVWPPAGLNATSLGDHWRPCSNNLPFPLHPTDFLQDITGRLWMTVWGNAGLYYSDDGGESWEQANPDPACVVVYTITLDDAGVLYLSANDGLVFRSLDGGSSWQQVGSLPWVAAHTPWAMTAHPDEPGVVYAGTFGDGAYVSQDYGFTWAELDDAATAGANENDDLVAGGGGHIFDIEFSPDADAGGDYFLYVGTGEGVWRAELDAGTTTTFEDAWTLIGPTVTLNSGPVTPEVRTIAFVEDGGDLDDNLVAGTWGFGAYEWVSPNASDVHAAITLKEGNVSFVVISPQGDIFLGTEEGVTTVVSSGATSTSNEPGPSTELPDGYVLGQNYPNPFNPVTTIGFALPETGKVRLAVFDALGREVALLADGALEAGHHEVQFQAGQLPTGTYLYRLSTEAGTLSRTLVLMK